MRKQSRWSAVRFTGSRAGYCYSASRDSARKRRRFTSLVTNRQPTFHIQHTILHELGHIVLGHHEARDTEEIDIEQEAEDFGYQLLVAVHGVGAFLSTSKNPSVAARYESLMSL